MKQKPSKLLVGGRGKDVRRLIMATSGRPNQRAATITFDFDIYPTPARRTTEGLSLQLDGYDI